MSQKEIVINAEKDQTRIAIVEGGKLAELFIENPENERTIGNICLGRVRRVMPSIQAAFVDIGQEQDAFLHFSDLSDSLPLQLKFLNQDAPSVQRTMEQHGDQDEDDNGNKKRGKRTRRRSLRELSGHLEEGQRLLVKIIKEPISQKGSRISTDLSIAGRFLVLVPFTDFVAVSNKITSDKEQRRLKALASSLLPEGFGVIVRTAAQGRDAKTLDTDLRLLKEKWDSLEERLKEHPSPPQTMHEDVNMVSSIMRDLFTTDYDRVLVDYPRLHHNIKSYVQAVAPQKIDDIQLHKGDQPIFQAVGIEREVAEAFKSRVSLPSGGYLFIEHTEAMHVIDVNSGGAGRGMSQEESSLKVNLEAARTIARQTRLRDLGGIIVVDFIDLRDGKNRKKVYDELKKVFDKDRAVSKILPMSDFGLVQITRQRLRPSLTKAFSAPEEEPPRVEEERQIEEHRKEIVPSEPAAPTTPEPSSNGAPAEETAAPPTPASTQPVSNGVEKPTPPRPDELVQAIEDRIAAHQAQGDTRVLTLRVHPFTAAYLTRRVPDYPTRWFMKHLVRVHLEPDAELSPADFRFEDPQSGDELTDRADEPTTPAPEEA